jgi:Ca2+-transporting ATPase
MTQLLWLNIIMDTLAGLAFAGEAALQRYMLEKPIRRDEPLINPICGRRSCSMASWWPC